MTIDQTSVSCGNETRLRQNVVLDTEKNVRRKYLAIKRDRAVVTVQQLFFGQYNLPLKTLA